MKNDFFIKSNDRDSIGRRIFQLDKAKVGFYSIGLYPASLAYNCAMQSERTNLLLAPRPGRELFGAFSDDLISDLDLDCIINNAGITRDNLLMRMSEDQWDEIMEINLKSAFNLTKGVLRTMLPQPQRRLLCVLRTNPPRCSCAAARVALPCCCAAQSYVLGCGSRALVRCCAAHGARGGSPRGESRGFAHTLGPRVRRGGGRQVLEEGEPADAQAGDGPPG